MPKLDISRSLVWIDDLPCPNWDIIDTWLEKQPESARAEASDDVARQWLEHLGQATGDYYAWSEGKRTLVFGPKDDRLLRRLLECCDASQQTLMGILPGIAEFRTSGKLIVLAWHGRDHYYRYVGRFHGEGTFGASAGMHIRDGRPHIALCHIERVQTMTTLAHETTHASLAHLDLPEWLEEGLAQMFENDMTGRPPLLLEPEQANKHRKYWHKHGLDAFWSGEGFHRAGNVQELSYQLAEILIRLLISDHRPGWFSSAKQKKLLAFLANAKNADAGRDAALEHLEYGLDELAAKFLGPIEHARGPKPKRNPSRTWNGDRTRD